MKRKHRKINFGRLLNSFIWAFLFATLLVLLTPTPERDTGPPKGKINFDEFVSVPKTQKALYKYLNENGFTVDKDEFPIVIEVSKKQVEGNPSQVAKDIAQKAYELTGRDVKIILSTFGGKYIAQHSTEPR